MIVCRAVGQEITGARLFIQAGKFFERAPDEMPYACYWDRRRRRTTRRSARACACSGACSSPVVVLLPRLLSTCSFSINADFMDISGRAAIKFPVLYRDEAKNARDANGSCTFANWRVEKGHRPAPARRQNEPGDSSVMAVVKRRSRNRNRRFANTKPTDDPLVITVCHPRFVVARTPLTPPPQIVWCRRAKDCVTERTSLAPALIYNHVDGAARGTIR
jgi:hypothetical protein